VSLVWKSAPGWTLLNLLMVIVQGFLPLAGLYLIKQIIDVVTQAVTSPDPRAFLTSVLFWVALAGGVALLGALANALSNLMTEAQSLACTDYVADLIHAKSISIDLCFYEDPTYHDNLHRAQREAPYRPNSIVAGLIMTLQNSISVVGIVSLLFAYSWLTGLVLFAAALPAAMVHLFYARRKFDFEQEQVSNEREACYYHTLMVGPTCAKEVRLLRSGNIFAKRFHDLREQLRLGRMIITRQRAWADFLVQGLAAVAIFGTLAFMTSQTLAGVISVGALVMYFQGFQRAVVLLQGVLRSLATLYEDNLFLDNFYSFLDLEPKIKAPANPSQLPAGIGSCLAFHDVSFTYPGSSRDSLHCVDFDLQQGEVVVLVGENGAGKTTLVKLLCRLYDPDSGCVTIDGVDLRKFDPVDWRRRISIVFQDYLRYDLSVRENIWLGDVDTEATDEKLREAAKLSGIDSVIDRLPKGYDNVLGTQFGGGRELSVGEWQKLALARAFYAKSDLVILDEPSSALDPLAEADLIRRFRQIVSGRSALIISHRLASVKLADRILVMAHGQIVESGTHSELLALDGHYAGLYASQSAHYQS
jgi:ATP-binding cassette subfamily B protein